MNPTDLEHWQSSPKVRNAHATLVPLSANSPWSQALGPTHFAWMFRKQSPDHWKEVTAPDLWFVYRTNPSISFWDTPRWSIASPSSPSWSGSPTRPTRPTGWPTSCCPSAPTWRAPSSSASAAPSSSRRSGTTRASRCASRRSKPRGDTRDFTDIATELAVRSRAAGEVQQGDQPRCGLHGAATGKDFDFGLDPAVKHSARGDLGPHVQGRERRGHRRRVERRAGLVPRARLPHQPDLAPGLVPVSGTAQAGHTLRDALSGTAARASARSSGTGCTRTASSGGTRSSPNTRPCPPTRTSPASGTRTRRSGCKLEDYPFWLITARSMQYAWGSNVGIPLIDEVAGNLNGHRGVIINRGTRASSASRTATSSRSNLVRGQDRGPGGAARRHTSRHAAHDRPVQSLGDALCEGHEVAEHEFAAGMSMALTDGTGSVADLVRVKLYEASSARSTYARRRSRHDHQTGDRDGRHAPLGHGRSTSPLRRAARPAPSRASTPTTRCRACSGGRSSTSRPANIRTSSASSGPAASIAPSRPASRCARPAPPGSATTGSSP